MHKPTKNKPLPRPGDLNIYDDDGNIIAFTKNAATLPALARQWATALGTIVYAYCGNGRDAFEPAPKVGLGCTMSWTNDRHAGTIIAVSPSGTKVTVQQDKATRTDDNGMSQDQSYTFERDPSGVERVFNRQGDGSYKTTMGARLTIGVRGEWFCYEQ